MNKHIVWAVTLFLITFIICSTIIWVNYNSWTIRFEMDDNTKEAIESIEFDEINEESSCYYDGCNYHCCNEIIGCYSTLNYCDESEGERNGK